MTETPRPEKWATIRRLHLNAPYGSSPAGQYWYEPDAQPIVAAYEKALAEGDAARAADAARHQQEIAAKDAELDKLRVFLGDASPKSDALRRQFDAEIATLRATVDQQAETIHQLQATLPELHDAIERQIAQIAALTQERDEEARAFKRAAKDRDICRQKRVDLEAHCATLTAALKRADEAIQA